MIMSILFGFLVSCTLIVFMLPSRYRRTTSSPASNRPDVSVQVLVLGDIGRSPRMQYHAESIARRGGRVDLIGYQETPIHPEIMSSPRIKIRPLDQPPRVLRSKSIPFIVGGPLKVIWQIFTMIHVLGYETPPAQWLLIQNPPSIPTLAIAAIISRCRNTKLLIDWHNYGWTILSGTRGARHPFVRISKIYECFFGRTGHANLTVTHAMARQLRNEPYLVKTPIVTMHDRPAEIFTPINYQDDRLAHLSRILDSYELAADIVDGHNRLIVSSTSWTPDEDFGLFLTSLVKYAANENGGPPPVPLLVVITGKGPQRAEYEALIADMVEDGLLPNVTIRTAFLSFRDYATLLACADLGVCLHMSSSGVDLPMKVVDMFGAGLPVAAYSDYESFEELVKEGYNGCGFKTAGELTTAMARLLSDEGRPLLNRLRKGAIEEGTRRWNEEWDKSVAHVLGF